MKTKPSASSPLNKHSSKAPGFFSAFFKEQQNNIHNRNHVLLYPAKVVIVKQDTPANEVYLIEYGLVKLVRETSEEGHKIIVGLRHRDWLIGVPAMNVRLLPKQQVTIAAFTVVSFLSDAELLRTR